MKYIFAMFFCIFVCSAMAETRLPTVSYATNADNLTTGTVDIKRLPVRENAGQVAAGDDRRFDTISVGKPDVVATEGRVVMWIEK